MKDKKNLIFIGVVICLTLFVIASTVIFKIFDIEILPAQFFGALLGVIITVIITAILLKGQSSSEEEKDRNMRIFEEKTKRYNNFIEELWNVWEDREVTLEELMELMKLFSKDIVMFTKRENADDILDELLIISKQVKEENQQSKNLKIQQSIYSILNILSKEIDLGGCIDKKMQKKIDELEKEIIPHIEERKRKLEAKILSETTKNMFIEKINAYLSESDFIYNVAFYDKMGEEEFIFIELKPTPIFFMIGPICRKGDAKQTFIRFYVEYIKENIFFNEYRKASRGENKEFLGNGVYIHTMPNFFNTELDYLKEIESNCDAKAIELANSVINFYNNWRINDISIEQIINNYIEAKESK